MLYFGIRIPTRDKVRWLRRELATQSLERLLPGRDTESRVRTRPQLLRCLGLSPLPPQLSESVTRDQLRSALESWAVAQRERGHRIQVSQDRRPRSDRDQADWCISVESQFKCCGVVASLVMLNFEPESNLPRDGEAMGAQLLLEVLLELSRLSGPLLVDRGELHPLVLAQGYRNPFSFVIHPGSDLLALEEVIGEPSAPNQTPLSQPAT